MSGNCFAYNPLSPLSHSPHFPPTIVQKTINRNFEINIQPPLLQITPENLITFALRKKFYLFLNRKFKKPALVQPNDTRDKLC